MSFGFSGRCEEEEVVLSASDMHGTYNTRQPRRGGRVKHTFLEGVVLYAGILPFGPLTNDASRSLVHLKDQKEDEDNA